MLSAVAKPYVNRMAEIEKEKEGMTMLDQGVEGILT